MRHVAALLVGLVGLATLVGAAPAGETAAAPTYEVHNIETRFEGVTIRVEIQRDTRFDAEGQGALLTYSPYHNIDDATTDFEPANDSLAARYNPRRIARVKADVVGTRGSTGCWDYGGRIETETGIDVVKWIAAQPWSNGRVVMMGGSYNGTTANMVASRGEEVPELVGIVPEAAIAKWYGYSYFDGVRWFLNSEDPSSEGVDTPLAFDFGFAYTVPADDGAADVAASRTDLCDRIEHTERGYDRTPDYTEFWRERDYRITPENFRAAALITHGWQDVNVKPNEAIGMFESIPVDDPDTEAVEGAPFKRLWMTQSGHSGAGGPEFDALLDTFLFETLLGQDHGLADTPVAVRSVGASADGAMDEPLRATAWPPEGTGDLVLNLDRYFTYPTGEGEGLVGSDGEVGILTPDEVEPSQWAWFDGAGTEPATQEDLLADDQHGYTGLFYTSAPLGEDARVAGAPTFEALVTNQTGGGTHLTPIVVDVAEDGTVTPVHRGFLNLDYRDGLEQADPYDPATGPTHVSVDFLPRDHVFEEGHRIGLIVRSTNDAWAVRGTPGGLWSIWHGAHEDPATGFGARLRLPVVDGAEVAFRDDPR